jgi:hypothetical protein
MSAGRAEASAVLSRRAGGRVRLVEVKLRDGRVLSLDFSVEPGVLSVDGTEAVFESGWDSAPRPLAASVGSFLEVVARPERSDRWPLAAQFCRQHVAGALAALDLARASEARLVARHLAAGSPAVPEKIAAILVDNLAPELADMGLSAEARRCSTDRAAALSLAEAGLAKLRSRPVQVEAAVGMALDRSAFLAALRGALQA